MSIAERDASIAYQRDQGFSADQLAQQFQMSAQRIEYILQRFDHKLARQVVARVTAKP